MTYIYSDGGRAEAGYKGDASDCVVRAIAIVTERLYDEVYREVANYMAENGEPRSARNGIPTKLLKKYFADHGWTWTPTMSIGSGTTVHLRYKELPKGRIIANVSKHVVACIDGDVFDTYDPTREGTRAVYGYWRK